MSGGLIADRIAEIEHRIARACVESRRPRSEVTLIAVAKTQPDERVQAASAAGLTVFGENYVQELERHHAAVPGATWHVIGHLQTNKAKKAAELASMIHTVDSPRLATALGKASAARTTPLAALVEVNLGGEASKSGCAPDAIEAVIAEIRAHPGLVAAGLMCIPPPDDEPRRWFAALRAHADRLRAATGLPLPELSMGMSADFEDAIREGATLVRVGTAIFGERLA